MSFQNSLAVNKLLSNSFRQVLYDFDSNFFEYDKIQIPPILCLEIDPCLLILNSLVFWSFVNSFKLLLSFFLSLIFQKIGIWPIEMAYLCFIILLKTSLSMLQHFFPFRESRLISSKEKAKNKGECKKNPHLFHSLTRTVYVSSTAQ